MQLSAIISRELRVRKWNQADLAKAADMPDHMVSRILHGDVNWTARTAGRLTKALGIQVRLCRVSDVSEFPTNSNIIARYEAGTDGEEKILSRHAVTENGFKLGQSFSTQEHAGAAENQHR
jgi:transcriptional regulator with XRE-family HTH domain